MCRFIWGDGGGPTARRHCQDPYVLSRNFWRRGLGIRSGIATLPNERKHEEVEVGHQIVKDVAAGRFISVPDFGAG